MNAGRAAFYGICPWTNLGLLGQGKHLCAWMKRQVINLGSLAKTGENGLFRVEVVCRLDDVWMQSRASKNCDDLAGLQERLGRVIPGNSFQYCNSHFCGRLHSTPSCTKTGPNFGSLSAISKLLFTASPTLASTPYSSFSAKANLPCS